jgi:ketosteroid isomerase-like protein
MRKITKVSSLLVMMFLTQHISAQGFRRNSAENKIRNTANDFVAAFVSLDWERFRSYFAGSATAFFPPSAKLSARVDGKRAIENVFAKVFENARKQNSSPPYLKIEPLELRIQMLGDVAVVTFHLNDPGMFGRRTVVFRKFGKRWLIVHLHAAGVPI